MKIQSASGEVGIRSREGSYIYIVMTYMRRIQNLEPQNQTGTWGTSGKGVQSHIMKWLALSSGQVCFSLSKRT